MGGFAKTLAFSFNLKLTRSSFCLHDVV